MAESSSFTPAFWLLPREKRHALFALHRFCRAADNAVDQEGLSRDEAAQRLSFIRQQLEFLYQAKELELPEARTLAPYVRRFDMERSHFEMLLTALHRDLDNTSLADEQQLLAYCEGVASAPGYLALAIFECPEAHAYARSLGIALQCTNIYRDARTDLIAGRIYLPVADLERLGLTGEELVRNAQNGDQPSSATRELLLQHGQRALEWFSRAESAYYEQPVSTRRKLAAARGMQRIYRALLHQLLRGEPFQRHSTRVSKAEALFAVFGSWCEAQLTAF